MRICQHKFKDESVTQFFSKKENRWAVAGTAVIWVFIFILMIFMPGFHYESQYKTIEITLQDIPRKKESKPVEKQEVKKQEIREAVTSPAAASSSSSASSKAGKNTREQPAAAKAKPKAESTKTSAKKPASIPEPSPVVRQSIEEQMAQMQNTRSAKKDFDWSMFDDAEEQTSSTSPSVVKANSLDNALSGSSASSDSSGSGAVSSKSSDAKSSSTRADNSTSSALNAVMSAQKYSTSTNGVSSTITASSATINGQRTFAMADGSARALLYPKEPRLELSESAAALIGNTITVTISFTVTADGQVPVNSIKINPASVLGTAVQNEVVAQISKFKFSSASSEGKAKLDYTIRKN